MQLRASVCGLHDRNVTLHGEVGKQAVFNIENGLTMVV